MEAATITMAAQGGFLVCKSSARSIYGRNSCRNYAICSNVGHPTSRRCTASISGRMPKDCTVSGAEDEVSSGKSAACSNVGLLGDRANCVSRKICIVWFKKDLRIDDHPGLAAACSGWSRSSLMTLANTVLELKSALQSVGTQLVIRIGSSEDAILRLAQQVRAADIFTEEETEHDFETLVHNTQKTLSLNDPRECSALRTWRASLYENQDVEVLSDDYRKYNAIVQDSVLAPLEAPQLLPPLPNGVSTGRAPTIEELEQMIATTQTQRDIFKKEGAQEALTLLLERRRTTRLSRRKPAWLRRIFTHFQMMHVKNNMQENEPSGTSALQTLKTYLESPHPDWRMREFQTTKKGTFFHTVLALGTVSLRRIYHEAVLCNEKKRISSKAAAAAIEEVKVIETRLQEADSGWHVRAWRWRGFLIQYTTCGDHGPPMVLVHGFGAFWQHYRDNIRELAGKGNRVWALTMLGFGRSEKPGIVYTEVLWAELLRDFIIEVVGEPVILVGNSLGGYIASLVSGLWSPLVRALVLLNSAGIVDANYQSLVNLKVIEKTGFPQGSSQILLFFLQQQAASAFKLCYPSKSERVDQGILGEALRASYDPGAAAVLESMFHLRLPLPLNFLLDQYDGEIMLLQGVYDPLQNALKKACVLQACCKNVTVRIVNAGHCPHDEVPEEVNNIIDGWVKDTCTNSIDTANNLIM